METERIERRREEGRKTMTRTLYRWRIVPLPKYGIDAVEVIGASRYEAVIAAAKLWRTPWTQIARACTFERLGEVIENG